MRDVGSNQLDVSVRWSDHSCVLAVAGELDIATVDVVNEAVSAALDVTSQLIIDLERVSFADARSVASLARSARLAERRGKSIAVRNWPPSIERVLVVFPEVGDSLGQLAARRW